MLDGKIEGKPDRGRPRTPCSEKQVIEDTGMGTYWEFKRIVCDRDKRYQYADFRIEKGVSVTGEFVIHEVPFKFVQFYCIFFFSASPLNVFFSVGGGGGKTCTLHDFSSRHVRPS